MPIGPPIPPESPLVTAINLTALNVSWAAPWPLPVSNYTLIMTNTTSSQILNEWTITGKSLSVVKTWQSDCDTLEFAVRANTDVGSSSFSPPRITGFPNGKMRPVLPKIITLTLISSLFDN